MNCPKITFAFQSHANSNDAMANDVSRKGGIPTSDDIQFFDFSQQIFLIELKKLCSQVSAQQICNELDAVDRLDLCGVLGGVAGREELKSIPKLHTALLLYTTKGLTEEQALARTAGASQEEIMRPDIILLKYLASLLPENNPQRLKALEL